MCNILSIICNQTFMVPNSSGGGTAFWRRGEGVTAASDKGLVEQLGGLQVAGGNDDHYEDRGDHHDYDGTCGIAFGGFQVAGDVDHHDDQDRWSS